MALLTSNPGADEYLKALQVGADALATNGSLSESGEGISNPRISIHMF